MKMKLVLALALIVLLGVFTGCEPAPTLPEILSTVKGYKDELTELVLTHVESAAPTDFTEGDSIPVDDGITCIVDAADADELNLIMSLDNWVANDGTEITGTIAFDIEYDPSTLNLSMFRMVPAIILFERTSASFVSEAIDEDVSTEAFVPAHEYFFCTSLIVDGEILMLNIYGY
jgi:hypothetical protein